MRARRLVSAGFGTLVRVQTDQPLVALTFDDGPSREWTPPLLAVLERYGAKATFFLDGPAAEKHPWLVRSMHDAGHATCVHGWSHRSAQLEREAGGLRRQVDDIRRCARAIGSPTKLYRPPFGHESRWTPVAAALLGFRSVYWTVSVGDWHVVPAPELSQRIVAALQPGSIVLLHDRLRHAADPLAFDRGYLVQAVSSALEQVDGTVRFLTVPDLLRAGSPVHRLRRRVVSALPAMIEQPA